MSTGEIVRDEVTALIVIEPKDVQLVFSTAGALDPVLQRIAQEARSLTADVSTATGRKEIASMAFKVARAKTLLDGLGKDLVDGLKELPRQVDANRKQMREFLDALKDEVRQPLTAWEAEEERKKQAELARIEAERLAREIEQAHEIALLLDAEFDRQREARQKAAEEARKAEADRIVREATERATREAEQRSKAEREASLRRETEARLAQERAEREKADAERRAREADERAERERLASSERAERAKVEAVEKERERREAEERSTREKQAKLEANRSHQRKINNDAMRSIVALGFDETTAKDLVTAIANGKVLHVSLNY